MFFYRKAQRKRPPQPTPFGRAKGSMRQEKCYASDVNLWQGLALTAQNGILQY
jgi:hypothetical protein